MCFSHNAPLGSGQLHDSWYTGPRQQERRWGNQAFIKRQFKKKNKKLLTIYLDLEFVMVRNWILSQHKAVPWFNWLLNKYCFKKDLIRIIFSNIWYKLWDKAYNSRCITLYDVAVLHVFNKKLDYSPDQVFFPPGKDNLHLWECMETWPHVYSSVGSEYWGPCSWHTCGNGPEKIHPAGLKPAPRSWRKVLIGMWSSLQMYWLQVRL